MLIALRRNNRHTTPIYSRKTKGNHSRTIMEKIKCDLHSIQRVWNKSLSCTLGRFCRIFNECNVCWCQFYHCLAVKIAHLLNWLIIPVQKENRVVWIYCYYLYKQRLSVSRFCHSCNYGATIRAKNLIPKISPFSTLFPSWSAHRSVHKPFNHCVTAWSRY